MKLLALLLAIPAYSQVTIGAPGCNSVTDRSARCNVTVSAQATLYAQFGTAYGSRSAAVGSDSDNAVVDVSGLAPGTIQDVRVCQVGFTPPTGCSAAASITTLAAASPDPIAPTIPDTAYPVSFTAPTLTVDQTCSNLATHIATKKALDGNGNHLIVIPAGVYCAGMLSVPVKSGANPSGTGQIVIASGGTLPPEGTRLTTDYSPQLATIYQTSIIDTSGTSNPGTCIPVTFFWRTDTTAYQICLTTNTWTLLSATAGYSTGSGAPSGTCVSGRYYADTGGTARDNTYYCPASLQWVLLTRRGDGGWAATADASAKGYRFVGVRFDNAIPGLSTDFPYLTTDSTASNIIADRCYFKNTLPGFAGTAFAMDGANISMINSLVDVVSLASAKPGINISAGTGPFNIQNNSLNSCFIPIFVNDNGTTVPRDDITMRRNTITMQAACNPRSASPDGNGARDARGGIELKRGRRVWIDGNIFQDTYSGASVTAGATIVITPRATGSTGGDDNAYQMSDIDITNNIFRRVEGGIQVLGNDDAGYRSVRMTERVRIRNNLGYDVDGSTYYADSPKRGGFVVVQDGVVGLNVSRNSWYNARGTGPGLLTFNGGPFGDLAYQDNIVWINQGAVCPSGCGIRWNDATFTTLPDQATVASTATAKVKLDKSAISGTTTNYTFSNNAIVGGEVGYTATYSAVGQYPAGNRWPGDTASGIAALGFTDTANENYRLRFNSDYAPFGVGADQDAIRAAMGETYNGRALSVTPTTATVAYTAPDPSVGCSIEYGISATSGTGTRVIDTAGSRFRTKALTGLTGGVVYFVRLLCAQEYEFTFTTL